MEIFSTIRKEDLSHQILRIKIRTETKLNTHNKTKVTNQELKNKNFLLAIVVVFLSLTYSCSNSVILDSNKEFEDKSWNVDDVFETAFDISDTINNYNFFITLRNTDEYPYQNLFVFLTTSFPNGKTKLDTINCPLANRQGKWLGKGFGGVMTIASYIWLESDFH